MECEVVGSKPPTPTLTLTIALTLTPTLIRAPNLIPSKHLPASSERSSTSRMC